MESSCIEPSAQTQNFAASSGFLPFALATKAHPPKLVICCPLGGEGRGKTPYWKSLALTRKLLTPQTPRFCMAQKPEAKFATTSAPPKPKTLRGATFC